MATIKGIWKWNEVVTRPTNGASFHGVASFVCCGVNYRSVYVINSELDNYDDFYINYIGSPSNIITYIDNDIPYVYDEYRTMDFGETEQAVSNDFYNYLVANATPVVNKVKGKWKWNNTIVSSANTIESVSFVSDGRDFTSIEILDTEITYCDSIICVYYYNTGLGFFEQYREMDFGLIEQEVSEEFYKFLVANATALSSSTTYSADITSLTAIKHRTDGEAEISTQVDKNGLEYTHIATNDDTTVTTITAENIPVGKIMFFKYRLCNGYYPAGHLGVTVRYKSGGETKLAVGTRSGGVLNVELAKRHRGWVVGRVNAQGQLKSVGLWTSDDVLVQAESIEIEIAHKDDLDIAYFMTDNYDANLMPIVKEYGDDYYMHQNIEFGAYIENQWRKINDTMSGGIKQTDPFTPPGLPEHPEEGDPVYYTLVFDLNGHGHGTDLSARTIKKGKKANAPNDPTDLYEFEGWYSDAECTREYDFNTPVTSNFTLYAKWSNPSIAKKLQWIAGRMRKVYDAGYEEGKSER